MCTVEDTVKGFAPCVRACRKALAVSLSLEHIVCVVVYVCKMEPCVTLVNVNLPMFRKLMDGRTLHAETCKETHIPCAQALLLLSCVTAKTMKRRVHLLPRVTFCKTSKSLCQVTSP